MSSTQKKKKEEEEEEENKLDTKREKLKTRLKLSERVDRTTSSLPPTHKPAANNVVFFLSFFLSVFFSFFSFFALFFAPKSRFSGIVILMTGHFFFYFFAFGDHENLLKLTIFTLNVTCFQFSKEGGGALGQIESARD